MAFAWPLSPVVVVRGAQQPRKVSSGFGTRTNPITGELHTHGGIDIPADVGTVVRAIAPGVVETIIPNHVEAGTYIEVNHGNGYWSRYLHLSNVTAQKGAKVTMGTPIALSGGQPGAYGAGASTGPHLHLEIWQGKPYQGGHPIDPFPLLTQEATALALKYWWAFVLGASVVGGALVWRFKPEWLR